MRPPRFARALLVRIAPPSDRPWLIDDLDEEFAQRARESSARAARRWYLGQVAGSLAPLLLRRLRSSPSDRSMILGSILQDLRFALRSFAKRPAFTLVAVVTIGLGVGVNTAIFSLLNGVLLGAVPGMADTDGLVEVTRDLDGDFYDLSWPIVREIGTEVPGLTSVGAFNLEPVSILDSGEPSATVSYSVDAGYFRTLGLSASRGRLFDASEATPPEGRRVVVLSEPYWRTRMGAEPDVVGRSVRVNGVPLTVVGSGPEGFRGHTRLPVDVFVPLGAGIQGLPSSETLTGVENGVVEVVARRAEGASPETLEAAIGTVGQRLLEREVGAEPGAFRARVDPWGPIPAVGRGPLSAFSLVLMIVVGMVLAVACVNVAGMLLSRATERRDELALRRALGAGRGRIARQLLTESVLLFLGGGIVGVLLSTGLTRLLLRFEPPLPPGFELPLDLGLDGRVLGFALGITTLTAVLFNLLPALRTSRAAAPSGARGPARTRGRSLLVAGQMAGSLALLVVAGLFLRSLTAVQSLDPGWEAEGVLVAELELSLLGLDEEAGRVAWTAILERARAIPGVTAAGLASKLPLGGTSSFGEVSTAGFTPPAGATGLQIPMNRVSPGYFETMGVEVREGRTFGSRDARDGERVAVVNERMARMLWPDGAVVGDRFWLGPVGSEWSFTVIGVVENTAVRSLAGPPDPYYYVPAEQWYTQGMALLVRSEAGSVPPTAVRTAIREVEPALPIESVLPLEQRLAFFSLPQRLAAWVSGAVGILGLVLAAVGVYGLTAFAVGRQAREIGVRLALGARPRDVLASVVRRGMVAPLVGMALGLGLAAGIARVASGFLEAVRPSDPWAYAGALLVLASCALLAAVIPAARAARLDPAETLRIE